jgi:DNA repair exonuclease SbcCD nuclease subunit
LQPDSVSVAGFDQLAKQVNRLHPDFVLTGGDMIYTAKSVNDKKAEILFDLMDKEFKMLRMPVYLTMGNHENVGITQESGIDKTNPMWGKKMYESRYGNRYYTFNYRMEILCSGRDKNSRKRKNYTGIDSFQIEWIKNELSATDENTACDINSSSVIHLAVTSSAPSNVY